MKYMGSKNRIAKYILPIMLEKRKPGQYWVEPFVGGGNMIDKVDGKRIGADINKYAIEALISIRDNLSDLPKTNKDFTEDDYKKLKTGNYRHKGYAGFALSYGGKWMGGWSRNKSGLRDYCAESYRNAEKQSSRLQNVNLKVGSYDSIHIPDNSIIYCDPPYEGTTKYNSKFDHGKFWDWCRSKAADGHTVFVSEYKAPPDFYCLYKHKPMCSSLTKDTGGKKAVECLFTLNNR